MTPSPKGSSAHRVDAMPGSLDLTQEHTDQASQGALPGNDSFQERGRAVADTAHLSRVRCGLARDTWKPGWGLGMCEKGHGWFFKLVWATAVRVGRERTGSSLAWDTLQGRSAGRKGAGLC